MGAGHFFLCDVPVLPGQIYRSAPTQVAMRVAFGFSGGLLIELLQQTNEGESVFTEMLDAHGEGYHHVMLRIPYNDGVERLSGEGYDMVFSGTMPGGERFALFDTRAGNGGYIELMVSPAMGRRWQRCTRRIATGTVSPGPFAVWRILLDISLSPFSQRCCPAACLHVTWPWCIIRVERLGSSQHCQE